MSRVSHFQDTLSDVRQNPRDQKVHRLGDIQPQRICRRFQGLQLTLQQRCGHEMVVASFHSLPDQMRVAIEENEHEIRSRLQQPFAVNFLQGGAGENDGFFPA